ncbi:MAG TPA: aminodeoxychorismate/anthranilate synthase component II [Candidatus Polarisedimenticolaceae bacterium]
MRVFLLDNYDSFTFNLAQYLQELGAEVDVVRNDRIGVESVLAGGYDAVVISPGPGRPEASGITVPLVRACAGVVPLLGVCLGHQAIGHAWGASVVRARELMHGKTSAVFHDGRTVFRDLASPFPATRYHSLVVDPSGLAPEIEVSARTEDGTVMGLRHRDVVVEGVQFHPESVLTPSGHRLLGNFLELSRGGARR